MVYDLEERIRKSSKGTISLFVKVKRNQIDEVIFLSYSASKFSAGVETSYCEVGGTTSRRDFRNKIFICRKEIQKVKIGEILAESNLEIKDKVEKILKGSLQTHSYFQQNISCSSSEK